ncbi:MAG TPA: hypothetical protein VIA64_10435 [Burkholderiales bacterium]|jgi:hypothetical protein
MTPSLRTALLAAALLPAGAALAEGNAELNRILEANASAAAFARICDEEPMSEQLKSSTMMLLAVNGLGPQIVQLGSAKFNDVMRREIAGFRTAKDVDCPARVKEARERLSFTHAIIQAGRRDAPSN